MGAACYRRERRAGYRAHWRVHGGRHRNDDGGRASAAQRAGYRGGLRLYHRMGGVPLSAETYGLPPVPVLYTADALLRRRAGFSLREASAAAQVAHSRTPMLFIHGGKDAFVPFAMLDEVYAAARCPKEKYVEPDAGHAESLRMAPARYWAKVFGFIGRWMPLPGAERTVAADPAKKPV